MSWVLVGVLLGVAFVFSGIEAGLLSLNRVRLRHLIKRGDRKALLLEALLRDGERMMITVLVVTNWATLAALFLSTRELVAWFGRWGYGVSLVLGVVTRLLVVEVFPRVLFRGMGYRAVAVWTVPLLWVDGVLGPMHRFGKWFSRRFFRKRLPTGHRLFVGREDFKYLASSGERGGEISPEAAAWIRRVIDFRSVPVGRLMRGFGGAVMVGEDVSVDALRGRGRREQWGRVLRRGADGVVTGWVDVGDVMRGAGGVVERRVLRALVTESALLVLRRMRSLGTPVAVVVEDGGGEVGYLFREDLERALLLSGGGGVGGGVSAA
jgi:CBS domain containing-hemolysin-like protein